MTGHIDSGVVTWWTRD